MRVTQVSIGRFHHFHLARQLQALGVLDRIWTGYPRFKLRDEQGIPADKIACFPWLHTVSMVWPRLPIVGRSDALRRELAWLAHDTLDRRVAWSLRQPCTLVALSGQGLHSGRKVKRLGGWHICDRGSSHIRYQDDVLREEHGRWGLDYAEIDPRVVGKEEAEYANADLITVPSGFAERSFVERGVAPEKLRRLPYGSRLDRFHPAGEPAAGCFDVLFVGHVSLRKGIPYLLDAFARLRHPNKRLRIVGGIDPQVAPLLDGWSGDRVEYLGTVPNSRLPSLYSTSSVLVLPSVEEGLAMVMAEAMACGCPVIASRNTGADDLFDDGREGFIVPARSSTDILRSFEGLLDQPDLAREFRHRAVARTLAMGGWDEYGRRWKDLLETLEGRDAVLHAGPAAQPRTRTAP